MEWFKMYIIRQRYGFYFLSINSVIKLLINVIFEYCMLFNLGQFN